MSDAQLVKVLERTGLRGRLLPPVDTSAPPFALPYEATLDLPAPISVNKSRRIDWRASKQTTAWRKVADQFVLAAKSRQVDPLRLARVPKFELEITVSEQHTGIDLDNGLKWLIDYLRRIKLIQDDAPANMRKLTVEWGQAPHGCRVKVRALA